MIETTQQTQQKQTIGISEVARKFQQQPANQAGGLHRRHAGDEAQDITEQSDGASGEPILDESEYAAAFQKGFTKTLRFLRSRGASEDLAEEVAQEAWARGWERLHQLRSAGAVEVWVASIAKHLWRNRVVRDQRCKELSENMAVRPDPDGRILWEQLVGACGKDERRLLNLHYVGGYTSKEIAKEVGCSALAVRLRLMRVRRKLDTNLDKDVLLAA